MEKTRQQLLFLCLAHPELNARTVAWALYDGSLAKGNPEMESGDQTVPPYASVMDALRDGWRVIQAPPLPFFVHGHENETGHLPWEYLLERMVEIDD